MKTFFLSLLFVTQVLAQTPVKPDPGANAPATTDSDKVAKVPTSWDDAKTARVLNSLAAQSGWFPKLKISVNNGMVSIEGTAKDADQLNWLAKTADRLPTVIAVINKASVEQPPVTDLTPAWNEFRALLNRFKRTLPLIVLAGALIALCFFVSKYIYAFVERIWGHHINNPFLLSTVTKISMIPVWLLFFYMTLQTAGLSSIATTIIGGTGVVGIVIGFAFKDIAENYLSGLLLAIRSPFTKGDDISVSGYDGYVQALNMRGTTILAYDGTMILIPNSVVIQSVIKNRSTNPRSRLVINIGIAYHDSSAKAIDLIYGVLKGQSQVLQDPAPLVIASDFTTSTLNIQVRFWVDASKNSLDRVKSNVIACVKETLLANGISIPDQQREIVFTDALKIQTVEDAQASQQERAKQTRERATSNLNESQTDHHETGENPDDQVKRLGGGRDMLEKKADADLVKTGASSEPV